MLQLIVTVTVAVALARPQDAKSVSNVSPTDIILMRSKTSDGREFYQIHTINIQVSDDYYNDYYDDYADYGASATDVPA